MDPDKAKEEIIKHLQELILENVPETETKEIPLQLENHGGFSVEIDKNLFVCPICIEPVEEPQKTSCCDRYVCSLCFARGAHFEVELPPSLTYEEQWDDIYSGRHRYPCCNQIVPRKALLSAIQYTDEDPPDYPQSMVFGMLRAVTPNDGRTGDKVFPFYMKKLRESMWKCTDKDCQAIINYEKRENHWENECGRFETCFGCYGVFRRSDKHACVNLLKIQINHTKSVMKRTIIEEVRKIPIENWIEFYGEDFFEEDVYDNDVPDETLYSQVYNQIIAKVEDYYSDSDY